MANFEWNPITPLYIFRSQTTTSVYWSPVTTSTVTGYCHPGAAVEVHKFAMRGTAIWINGSGSFGRGWMPYTSNTRWELGGYRDPNARLTRHEIVYSGGEYANMHKISMVEGFYSADGRYVEHIGKPVSYTYGPFWA